MTDLTEFTWLAPEEVHLVGTSANGFPAPLLAKAAEALDDVLGDAFSGDRAIKYVSASARRKYAQSGVAMGNGDFPIQDEGHLRSAIGHLGNYEGDKAAAKAHIIKRARALGLTHLLPEDWHVSKEEAEKETAPDKSVPTAEANSQTRQVSEDVGAGDPPDPGDGGTPTHQEMATTQPSRTTGEGDTAPDKGVPTGEAEAQTPGAQKEGDPHDGRGDPAPDGDGQARAAEGEAGSQTREVKKEGGPSDPGSTAWEHKDVALGEKAEALVSQLGEVIRTFTEREKAEGGASKGAGRIVAGIKYLLTNPNLLKECAEMPTDELIKALDELGAARQAAKKAKAKKAKKKAERKAAEAAEAAAKAAGDGAADDPLTKALAEVNVLREQVEKMASEDGKRILLNGTGLAAVLRSPEGPDVFKGLEDAFKSAQEEYEKDPSALKKAAMEQAGFRMTAAKMMVGESWRERTRSHSRLGPGTAELFTNRRALPADPAISYG